MQSVDYCETRGNITLVIGFLKNGKEKKETPSIAT